MALDRIKEKVLSGIDSAQLTGFNRLNRNGLHIRVISQNGRGIREVAASKSGGRLEEFYRTFGTTRKGTIYRLKSQKLREEELLILDSAVGRLRRTDGNLERSVISVIDYKPIGSGVRCEVGVIYSAKD